MDQLASKLVVFLCDGEWGRAESRFALKGDGGPGTSENVFFCVGGEGVKLSLFLIMKKKG